MMAKRSNRTFGDKSYVYTSYPIPYTLYPMLHALCSILHALHPSLPVLLRMGPIFLVDRPKTTSFAGKIYIHEYPRIPSQGDLTTIRS